MAIRKTAAMPPPTVKLDWRWFTGAICREVDWTLIARNAVGDPTLAEMVGAALKMIGNRIATDLLAASEAATRTEHAKKASPSTEHPTAPADEAPDEDPIRSAAGPDATASPPAAGPDATASPPAPTVDEQTARAAVLLGVSAEASESEIRAALRSLLSSSRIHPDHGGDGEEAKRLISARNLLIARARERVADRQP